MNTRPPRLRTLALAAALLALGHAADADEPAPSERATARLEAPRAVVYVGEVVPVTLTLEIDLEGFRASAVPVVPRALDIPLVVTGEGPGGERPLRPLGYVVPRADAGGLTLGFGDDVVVASPLGPDGRPAVVSRGGRPFAVLRVVRRYEALAPGTAQVGPLHLRYAWARGFTTDAFGERVPDGAEAVRVEIPALTFAVAALPTAGRPAGWAGLIGRFTLTARVEPATVVVGRSARLHVTLDGEGNAETLRAPPLLGSADGTPLTGFHLYGVLDPGGALPRTFDYEVAPLAADVRAVPPLEVAVFDPTPPAGYRRLRTEPLPLHVTPASGPASPPPAPPPPRRPVWPWAALAAFLVVLLRRLVRRRPRAEPPTGEARP